MKKASSVTELLKRKAELNKKKDVTIEIGDLCLTGNLLPIPHVLEITDDYDTDTKSGAFAMALELIYMTFPIFRSKEMQEENQHSEPHDIVLDILTTGEIQEVVKELNTHYGLSDDSVELKK